MSGIIELVCSRRAPHVVALALMSIGFSGCSADMSSRLSQNPYSNPYASQPEATGSVPTVQSRELPQYTRPQPQNQAAALSPSITPPQSYRTASAGVSGGGRGLASYAPPAHPIETTGTVAPRSVAATHSPVQAGTTIIVGTSDTLDGLARHYNVTPTAILQANGYKGPRALSPGQQLIIPRPTAAAAVPAAPALAAPALAAPALAAPALAAPASKVVAAAPGPSVHVVNPGDTLLSIARRNHVSVAELAKANNVDAATKLKLGTRLTVPAAKTSAAAQPVAGSTPPANKMAAVAGTPQSARLAQATTSVEGVGETPVKAADATAALPTFRWPVRGKVITSYGAKTNGKANDGINLAVPEGTPVKAAEDGVVAYSGNELKGYGNLILVRHANGYVTAYAHASELMVKRGDTIKRGQVIAKSGQSGEVASPQLHFEIRKGSQPVDPLQFLNGA
jgi:murein DD-endopeptidase MepM/ murein hydrolase activator NlpD